MPSERTTFKGPGTAAGALSWVQILLAIFFGVAFYAIVYLAFLPMLAKEGAYPSLNLKDLEFGDLRHTYDFRGLYATLLEQWMGVDSNPIVGGTYEQLSLLSRA